MPIIYQEKLKELKNKGNISFWENLLFILMSTKTDLEINKFFCKNRILKENIFFSLEDIYDLDNEG